MAIEIVIKVSDDSSVSVEQSGESGRVRPRPTGLGYDELIELMGDDIKPFPPAKIGGYMSHFRIVLELMTDPSQIISIVSPLSAQSVAWSNPFVYEGPQARHKVDIPLPSSSQLPSQIAEEDFIERPEEFFQVGKETTWLQILNLDARMDSEIGPVRIILGETAKREYPDIFQPSLGAAQSLGKSGFPARLFFNPFAIVETELGAFRAIHGVLSYGRVTGFPPIGTPVTIRNCIPLDLVDHIREMDLGLGHSETKMARILALSHPIDMELQLPDEIEGTPPTAAFAASLAGDAAAGPSQTGEAAYHFVERAIERTRGDA